MNLISEICRSDDPQPWHSDLREQLTVEVVIAATDASLFFQEGSPKNIIRNKIRTPLLFSCPWGAVDFYSSKE